MNTKRLLPLLVLVWACGGTNPKAADPTNAEPASSSEAAANAADVTREQAETASAEATAQNAGTGASQKSGNPAELPKPQFPPNASVDDAIKAVPQGIPRVNMSDDALQRPLMNIKQYEVCKVPRSTRVSITVAVFDGAAVGVDLTTKPKNAKIESCLNDLVRRLSWDKVPSLNTVTFNL